MKIDTARPLLVVDLDRTLVRTDTLYEGLLRLVRRSPTALGAVLPAALHGRLSLKRVVASLAPIDAASLPYDPEVLTRVREARARGDEVWLATAADRRVAQAVADHLGTFDAVLASEHENLKGERKARCIAASARGRPWTYVGDSSADVAVWRQASGGVAVRPGLWLRRLLARQRLRIEALGPPARPGLALLRAMRPYQWVKNLLVLVPVLTALRADDPSAWASAALALVAFCALASGTYLVNDLLDIDSDRRHPRKRLRPLASGELGVPVAVAAAAAALAAGLAVGAAVGPPLFAVLGLYLVATLSYSLVLKRYVLIDVLTLALLYTLRLVAGAVAIGVAVSYWLLGFSLFLFLSLALVKRCAELVALKARSIGSASGRNYEVDDLPLMSTIGSACAVAAVLVFALYGTSAETIARYPGSPLLWLADVALLYWLLRVWVKTARGEMHDDPIVYALRDRASRLATTACAALVILASVVPIRGWA